MVIVGHPAVWYKLPHSWECGRFKHGCMGHIYRKICLQSLPWHRPKLFVRLWNVRNPLWNIYIQILYIYIYIYIYLTVLYGWPQKRGRNIAGRRKGFRNGGPIAGTRVLHAQSAPFCVQWVVETPEPFVCFPGNGLDKASSKFHIEGPPSRKHFSYVDAAPKAGPGGSAVWAQPTDSQTHSPLPNCEEINCNGLCLGRHVAWKQARGVEPHLDKLQGDHATRNYCSSNPNVNKGSRPSHLWLITPLVRPEYALQTRM